MSEFISKHGIKIQVSVLIGLIVFVVTVALSAGGLIRDVSVNTEALARHEVKVEKIPVMQNDISTIKDDLGEIKDDIKIILKTK